MALVPGVGAASFRKLLLRFGSPQAACEANLSQLASCVGETAAQAIRAGPDSKSLSRSLQWLTKPGNELVTLADPRYPPSLLEIGDPPPLIYVSGRTELLLNSSLAIVGARAPTARGVEDAERFAETLSNCGLTIVSGLALGIDAAAHRGGLRGIASSVAVLGTGLDRIYPARNLDLAHDLAQHGALISELPIGTAAIASNFPRRNRLISGLTRGCLVVEAALHSGSLITARFAAEQGREVFAIPGSIHSPTAKGCHWLIKQGAKLVESAQDVLEELKLEARSLEPKPSANATPTKEQEAVLAAVDFAPTDLDSICLRARLTPDNASAMLLSLEFDGLVERLAGGFFQRKR